MNYEPNPHLSQARGCQSPRRPYPEALNHDPVMEYYIYESADPHLSNIGHEYHNRLLPVHTRSDTNKLSQGSSEVVYGHAHYLSNSMISNIPSDEIIFYYGSGMQCDPNEYNTNDKFNSME
ncbi:unnamed protein product [Phytomonas sp. Hart1]|nr:unnamed protein product [Phytomonas sp. Hart1]|eukprot:CCW69846.1 unnamed protein product [Phytomonas sp. isolate Hart1]